MSATPSTKLCNPLPTTDSVKLIINPCQADVNLLNAPSKLSPTMADISFAAPLALRRLSLNFSVASALVIICSNAAACLKSTTSIISAMLPPSATNFFIAGINSSKECIVFPKDCVKSEFGSCILSKMFLKDVPAIEASIPASVNLDIIAAVSSIENPDAFAIGATLVIEVCHFSISIADEVNATAITSTTLSVSLASKPNPLTEAPATVAALAKSEPVAVANKSVASCAFSIS